jgi:uncharacterized membrane protein (DUF2068 family)
MEAGFAAVSESKPMMTVSSSQCAAPRVHHHNRWLVLIAAYKLLGALLFLAIGVGAMRLLHKDIADVAWRIVNDLKFNPEGRFVNFVLDQASLVNDPMLRKIGFVAFFYAGVGILEAVGLYLEKAWGEILTVAITASFLPFEIHELMRRLSTVRVGLFVVNVLVLLYLLKVMAETASRRRLARKAAHDHGVKSHT